MMYWQKKATKYCNTVLRTPGLKSSEQTSDFEGADHVVYFLRIYSLSAFSSGHIIRGSIIRVLRYSCVIVHAKAHVDIIVTCCQK
jgi:hypothetical protein